MWQQRSSMLSLQMPRLLNFLQSLPRVGGGIDHIVQALQGHWSRRLAVLLQGWRHAARFLKLHKLFRKNGRRKRRDLFEGCLADAAQAEKAGDRQSLYNAIRRLAPRTARPRTQLRGDRGQLLSSTEEQQAFLQYCQDLFAPPDATTPHWIAQDGEPVPLTETELRVALKGLSSKKAVPRHTAAMLAWKLGADIVLPRLARICEGIWRQPSLFPTLWADSWLVWLPKPGKPASRPCDMRPISLTEAGGKLVAKAIANRIRPCVQAAAALWPQFAYVPGRCIDHAIARVIGHCDQVRTMLSRQRLTLQERRETGRVPHQCCGGIMVSIDTSKAFDTIDRRVLMRELDAAGVDPHDITLILAMHEKIGYHPNAHAPHDRVTSRRGVRQGCALAPTLWVLITLAVTRALGSYTSPEWVQECATLFADDLMLHYAFYSREALEKFLPILARCLDILGELGLQVQHGKTQVIIAGRGRQYKLWRRRNTRKTRDGPRLILWTGKGTSLQLPIVDSATYLGIKVSYGNYEKQTLQHRLAAAQAQRARLLRVLHHKGLPTKRRLQLWVTCIRSAALYGLHAVGLPQRQLERLTMTFTRHIRAIVGSYAHMHKESSQSLYQRVDLEDPLLLYKTRLGTCLESAELSSDPMISYPAVTSWLRTLAARTSDLVSHLSKYAVPVHHPPPPGLEDQVEDPPALPRPHAGAEAGGFIGGQEEARPAIYPCPDCSLHFADLAGLKAHLRKFHQLPSLPQEAGHFREHAMDGMPRCRHCLRDLKNYYNFRRHFAGRHCPVLGLQQGDRSHDTSAPTGEPPQTASLPEAQYPAQEKRPVVLPVDSSTRTEVPSTTAPNATAEEPPVKSIARLDLRRSEWLHIFRFPHIKQQLQHRCVICSQWLANIRSIKLHVRSVHTDIYNSLGQQATVDCSKVGHVVSPCKFCDAVVTRTDQHCKTCPVLWQSRLGALLGLADTVTPTDTCGPPDGDGPEHGCRRGQPLCLPHAAQTARGGADKHTDSAPAGAAAVQRDGQRKGRRQGKADDAAARGSASLQAWLRPAQSEPRRYGEAPSQADPPPGGLLESAAIRPHSSHHLPKRAEQLPQFGAGPGGGGRTMERAEEDGPRKGEPHAAPHPYGLHAGHPARSVGEGRSPAGGDQAGLAHLPLPAAQPAGESASGPTGGRCAVGVSLLEGVQAPGGPGGRNCAERGVSQRRGVDSGPAGQTESDIALCGHSATGGRNVRPHSDDDIGAFSARPPSLSNHGAIPKVVCAQRMAAHRRTHPSGPPGAVAADAGATGCGLRIVNDPASGPPCVVAAGTATSQDASSTNGPSGAAGASVLSTSPCIHSNLLRLKLVNPHNLCYLHAVIHLLSYVAALVPSEQGPQGMLTHAVNAVMRHGNRPIRVLDLLPWRVILQAWPHVSRQNDCSELLRYVLDRCRFPALHGHWEARLLQDARVQVTDSGASLIQLTLEPEHATVQDCVDAWHGQHSVHALTDEVSHLVFVLARYARLEAGKNMQDIACEPTTTVSVPQFNGDIQVIWRRFHLVGGIYHIGQTPQSGHYRAFAVHSPSALQSSASTQARQHRATQAAPSGMADRAIWCFDDGVAAVPCDPSTHNDIRCNAYVLCFQAA